MIGEIEADSWIPSFFFSGTAILEAFESMDSGEPTSQSLSWRVPIAGTIQPDFPIWITGRCIVRLSCPGHKELDAAVNAK
jgi:hypothetical protein